MICTCSQQPDPWALRPQTHRSGTERMATEGGPVQRGSLQGTGTGGAPVHKATHLNMAVSTVSTLSTLNPHIRACPCALDAWDCMGLHGIPWDSMGLHGCIHTMGVPQVPYKNNHLLLMEMECKGEQPACGRSEAGTTGP